MGLPPDPMFVDGPQFDGRLGKGRRHLAQQRTEVLLEVSLCLRVGLHVTRAGHLQAGTEATQVGPT
jgi:hypothetical protein